MNRCSAFYNIYSAAGLMEEAVTEACDCGADDALCEDEHGHEREPVRHLLLLLLLAAVTIATLGSVHVTSYFICHIH